MPAGPREGVAAGAAGGRGSGPAELVELVVVEAEVVGDLVDHRGADLLDDLFAGVAEAEGRAAVDEDPVRQDAGVPLAAFGEGVPS